MTSDRLNPPLLCLSGNWLLVYSHQSSNFHLTNQPLPQPLSTPPSACSFCLGKRFLPEITICLQQINIYFLQILTRVQNCPRNREHPLLFWKPISITKTIQDLKKMFKFIFKCNLNLIDERKTFTETLQKNSIIYSLLHFLSEPTFSIYLLVSTYIY